MAFTKSRALTIDWYGNLGNGIAGEELAASGIRVQQNICPKDLVPKRLAEVRRNAAAIARQFSASPVAERIWARETSERPRRGSRPSPTASRGDTMVDGEAR